MNQSPLVVPLAAARADNAVGAKARNLSRLAELGLAVPPALVLTNDAYRTFVDESDLRAPIAALTVNLERKSRTAVACAADTIGALFLNSPLPVAIRLSLDDHLAPVLPGPLIVRSSAIGEDSSTASFAGQLDSIGDVSPGGQLHRAIVRVWASRWSERALAYELARHVTLGGMGVVVQRQVASRLSGVLFTRSPEDDSQILIEYCCGMGEAVVSGSADPMRIGIRRADLRPVRLAGAQPHADEAFRLSDREMEELARAAMRVEAAFAAPQDIEWTIDHDGQLWFLQSRPITTPTRQRAQVHWSNANVNENFPEPITPLLYSIASLGYYHYFRNLGRAFGISRHRLARMEQPLRHIIGVHGARMYYNLSSIHAVLRSAPAGNLLAASFNQFVGSEDTSTPPASSFGSRTQQLARQTREIIVVVAKTAWQYARLTHRVERFERRVAAFADHTSADRLRNRALQGLLEDFRGFIDIRCHRWNDAALADAGSMVCYALLQRLLARAFPEADAAALHNSLLKALPDLVSSRPALELWQLAQEVRASQELSDLFAASAPAEIIRSVQHDKRFSSFRLALDRFLEDWGFRCSGELMLTVQSFQERPEAVVDLIKAYLDAPPPASVLREQASARLEATARISNEIRRRRISRFLPRVLQPLLFRLVLTGTQKSILLRERARLKQALLYSRLRRIVLEMGTRLSEIDGIERAEDLFFLTADEIDGLISGSAMFPNYVKPLLSLRRQAHADMSALTPPDSFTLAPGEYYRRAEERTPDGTWDIGHGPWTMGDGAASSFEMRGLGACGGSTTASAAVLGDVTESRRLTPGAILVTRQTDPGWGPIFPLVSGLVIERGGMLSHGAIIAREFGIPSVVGVKDATRRIPHGSRIRVDGDRGVVHLVGAEGRGR